MFGSLAPNRVISGALFLAVVYWGLVAYVDPTILIIFLNGGFVGSMVAILVAYHKLIWYAALGVGEYNRVRQMTLGFAVVWISVAMGATNSIYLRAIGTEIPATALTAATRYLAIIGACMQVTAPDFGLGLFHGRDRRVLWVSAVLGAIAAAVTIFIQDSTLLF